MDPRKKNADFQTMDSTNVDVTNMARAFANQSQAVFRSLPANVIGMGSRSATWVSRFSGGRFGNEN
jgi:hypothetical protein